MSNIYIKNYTSMKEFIRSLLKKLILESDHYTVANPISGTEPHNVTDDNLKRIIYNVRNAQEKYGHIKYFQDAKEGDGTYLAIINKNGLVTIKTPNHYIDDKEIGGVSTTRAYDNLEIPIRAYSGDDDLLQTGRAKIGLQLQKPYTKSGAADARIKVYVIFGDMIIDRVKDNVKGHNDADDYKDNTYQGRTDKQIARKDFIDQREKERAARKEKRSPITAFSSEKEKQDYLDKQEALRLKYAKFRKK